MGYIKNNDYNTNSQRSQAWQSGHKSQNKKQIAKLIKGS